MLRSLDLGSERSDRSDRIDHSDRSNRLERLERPDRLDRPDRLERLERERIERKPERSPSVAPNERSSVERERSAERREPGTCSISYNLTSVFSYNLYDRKTIGKRIRQ